MSTRTIAQTSADRDARLDALHDQLATAVQGLVTGEDWVAAMACAARFRSRSFSNTLLIGAQHADAWQEGRVPDPYPTLVAGFQQWRHLGRHVMRGQGGYMIAAPVTARYATATPDNAGSWRRLGRGERPAAGEQTRTKLVGVRPAYVWDVSQTDGEPIPQRPRPVLLEGQAPDGLWEALADQVTVHGFTLSLAADAAGLGGANGMTDFAARTVRVRGDMDPAARVKTLAHELAHIALGHADRGPAGLHRGIGEVEAESVAMMVTSAHGMDPSGYTLPYVATWATSVPGREPAEAVRATGDLVRVTAIMILDRLPAADLGDGSPPGLQPHDRSHHVGTAPRQVGTVTPLLQRTVEGMGR